MFEPAKFVISKSKLMEQYEQVKQHCDLLSYSAKTNYEVGDVLEEMTDCMFSHHSIPSLAKNDPARSWFLAHGWEPDEIEEVFAIGVRHFIIDNEDDLRTLLQYIEHHTTPITLLLRMRLKEHTIQTGKYFVYGMYSDKINELVKELKDHPQIQKLGVHFHRKSQNISEWTLQYELQDLLQEETLNAIDYLNMGGGLPITYKNFRAQVLTTIFSEITKLREWLASYNINLIIEPGRFLAGPSTKLVATIKNVYNDNVIINCSVYNTAIDTFVVHHKLEVEGELEKGTPYVLKGETPCSMDIFRYRVFLDNPKKGGTITLLNAGAYNFASDFCSLEKLPTEVEE